MKRVVLTVYYRNEPSATPEGIAMDAATRTDVIAFADDPETVNADDDDARARLAAEWFTDRGL